MTTFHEPTLADRVSEFERDNAKLVETLRVLGIRVDDYTAGEASPATVPATYVAGGADRQPSAGETEKR